jgi:hypothetical protein
VAGTVLSMANAGIDMVLAGATRVVDSTGSALQSAITGTDTIALAPADPQPSSLEDSVPLVVDSLAPRRLQAMLSRLRASRQASRRLTSQWTTKPGRTIVPPRTPWPKTRLPQTLQPRLLLSHCLVVGDGPVLRGLFLDDSVGGHVLVYSVLDPSVGGRRGNGSRQSGSGTRHSERHRQHRPQHPRGQRLR